MNLNRRNIIALVGVTASLALPVAAMAHSATNSSSTTSMTSNQSRADHPRINFAAIATELKLTTKQVQTAFRDNRPPKTGTRPTEAQRTAAITATAAALGVDVAMLKSLVTEYGGGAAQSGHKGPKAAAIAAQLGLSTAVVTKAIDDAHVTNPKPQGRPTEAQRNAFETAVAANLGLSKDTVSAAFAAVKAAHQAAKAS